MNVEKTANDYYLKLHEEGMNNIMLYIQKLLHQQNMALEGRLLEQNQDQLSKNLPVLDLSAEFLT